jgi:hypothetical protein
MSNLSMLLVVPLGVPLSGFIYATRLGFTSVLVEYVLEPSFFVSKSIFESLCLSTSIMGRTRYTNPWVPKGHIHVTQQLGVSPQVHLNGHHRHWEWSLSTLMLQCLRRWEEWEQESLLGITKVPVWCHAGNSYMDLFLRRMLKR